MGFDLKRIVGEVDDELKCGICFGLLERPVQLSECQHLFCVDCIKQFLESKLMCPIDRRPIVHTQIRAAPKLVTNLISRLEICCQFQNNGCQGIERLDRISQHIDNCDFNPRNLVQCTNGCRSLISRAHVSQHHCTTKVLSDFQSLESRVKILEYENFRFRNQLNTLMKTLGIADQNNPNTDEKSTKGKIVIRIQDKSLIIDADPKESISMIKERVKKLENLDSEELLVFMANKELEDDKSLNDYRIFRLHNPLVLFVVKNKINLLVKLDREKSYPIEMCPKNTVGDVLAQILKKEAFDSKDLVLTFRNQVLEESRTLFSYRIRDGNFVFLNTKTELQQRKVSIH